MAEPERFLPTRQSLLSRLKNWDDHDSWRDFFEMYWRLIYDVARKAGLQDAEAQDVVQETIVAVAGQMQDFRYDPTRGRFKGWLCQITRRRIADQLRKRYRGTSGQQDATGSPTIISQEALEELPDPSTKPMDEIWEQQWQQHLSALALARIKKKVRPEHFQIFDLYVLQGWTVTKVAKALGVSIALIYVTRHRVGALVKKELKRLQAEEI